MKSRAALVMMMAAVALFGLIGPGAHAGYFTTGLLTGDADSGITADKTYTHAINVNFTGNTTINGAVFTGSGSGTTNPSTNNYSTAGWDIPFNGNAHFVTGSVGTMLNDFLYNGNPETLTLRNLRVGQAYTTTFYNASFGGAGGRIQNITTSLGDATTFDENFTGDKNGNRLSYTYVAQSPTLVFTITPTGPASFHQYAFSNELIGGHRALLTDNFYAPNNPDTNNVNFNLAARQGGQLVQVTGGPITYSKVGNQQVGNNTGGIDGGNYLLSATGGVTSPDFDFGGRWSAGGQIIAFDMAPDVGNADGGNWAAFNLGYSQADRLNGVNANLPHFGILFRGDTGTLQAFDGNTNLTPVEPVWFPGGNQDVQLHHIEILLNDSTDRNPFDGIGQTEIEVFVNGSSVFSFTKVGGGYTDNYISFQGLNIAGFDNLVISTFTPEPGTLSLLALGGLGLLRRRRRKS